MAERQIAKMSSQKKKKPMNPTDTDTNTDSYIDTYIHTNKHKCALYSGPAIFP